MMKLTRFAVALVAPLLVLACGGDVEGTTSTTTSGAGGATSTSDATSNSTSSGVGTTGVGGSGGDWLTLIVGAWSLPAGSEGYFCVTATI